MVLEDFTYIPIVIIKYNDISQYYVFTAFLNKYIHPLWLLTDINHLNNNTNIYLSDKILFGPSLWTNLGNLNKSRYFLGGGGGGGGAGGAVCCPELFEHYCLCKHW